MISEETIISVWKRVNAELHKDYPSLDDVQPDHPEGHCKIWEVRKVIEVYEKEKK